MKTRKHPAIPVEAALVDGDDVIIILCTTRSGLAGSEAVGSLVMAQAEVVAALPPTGQTAAHLRLSRVGRLSLAPPALPLAYKKRNN